MSLKGAIEAANILARQAKSIIASKESVDRQIAEAHRVLEAAHRIAQETKIHQENIEKIILEKSTCFPWLAEAIADYYLLCEERLARSLTQKSHKAPKASQAVREASQRRREAEYLHKVACYRYRYYEHLFPWLAELIDQDIDDALIDLSRSGSSLDSEKDPSASWLTESEYSNLSVADRNQLALDRYKKSRKSKWQIGRDYERYIGYELEKDGFRVEYKGAIDGFDDLGRDLIAVRGSQIQIIQCKYWSKHKTIHEKHVFQLYGSVVEYCIDNGNELKSDCWPSEGLLFGTDNLPRPAGVLVVSNKLSPRAKKFAKALAIEVIEEKPLPTDYPCIKCNISNSKEKIYHLPFDQQYDRVVIEVDKGEFYAQSVHEAEKAGFRRARKWQGTA
jgi:hypothetical protein